MLDPVQDVALVLKSNGKAPEYLNEGTILIKFSFYQNWSCCIKLMEKKIGKLED